MALTTPDAIRSPNDGDQYALVQDLGVLADSVQTAVTRRANMYIGTTAQRTAFTTAPDGVHWQDTNGNRWEWVRTGGTWIVVNQTASGTYTGIDITVGTPTTYNVAFPVGLFSTVPRVQLSGRAPSTRIRDSVIYPSSESLTGFVINVVAQGTSSYTGWSVNWAAIAQ